MTFSFKRQIKKNIIKFYHLVEILPAVFSIKIDRYSIKIDRKIYNYKDRKLWYRVVDISTYTLIKDINITRKVDIWIDK